MCSHGMTISVIERSYYVGAVSEQGSKIAALNVDEVPLQSSPWVFWVKRRRRCRAKVARGKRSIARTRGHTVSSPSAINVRAAPTSSCTEVACTHVRTSLWASSTHVTTIPTSSCSKPICTQGHTNLPVGVRCSRQDRSHQQLLQLLLLPEFAAGLRASRISTASGRPGPVPGPGVCRTSYI